MKDQTIKLTTNSYTVQNDSKLETLTSRTWKRANRASTWDLGVQQLKDGFAELAGQRNRTRETELTEAFNRKHKTR